MTLQNKLSNCILRLGLNCLTNPPPPIQLRWPNCSPPLLSPQPVNPDSLPNSTLLIPLLLMLATNPFWTPNLYYKDP